MAASPSEILREPSDTRLIVLSLVLAFGLTLLPWTGLALTVRPDFTLLVLLYWCIHEPRRVGQAVAFGMGLAADVAESSVLGLHAFTYSIAVYLALTLRLRLRSFRLWQQAFYIMAILLSTRVVTVMLNVVLDSSFPGWSFFLGAVLGAALWPPTALLIESLQLRMAKADRT